MHPHEIEVGATYHVRPNPESGFLEMLNDSAEYDITVTAVGLTKYDEPSVAGVRVADRFNVAVALPPEEARRLGLPGDVDYVVQGVLVDAATGALVSRPTGELVTVPCRWLHPVE
ncbi:hypothetical protein JOF53_005235 [Crossiella equi]|uniref:Uncharacterized protein n=1 Tax=Crossiella equi TaxID=130796 RepID=A0ABS5AIF7_9PSEU|nr:hypothetical protein [Crossiella equi]MBP2476363.1 hypothetical protein [Crossiella equi]